MHEKTRYTLDNNFFVEHECLSIDDDGDFLGDDESIQNFQLTLFSSTKEKIGYVCFEINRESNDSEITLLGILKEHHKRQGHATTLLKLVFDILKRHEIPQVVLEVTHENIQAQNLYAKLGFVPIENQETNSKSNQEKRLKLIKILQ